MRECTRDNVRLFETSGDTAADALASAAQGLGALEDEPFNVVIQLFNWEDGWTCSVYVQ